MPVAGHSGESGNFVLANEIVNLTALEIGKADVRGA